jgi:hypothetical protein
MTMMERLKKAGKTMVDAGAKTMLKVCGAERCIEWSIVIGGVWCARRISCPFSPRLSLGPNRDNLFFKNLLYHRLLT